MTTKFTKFENLFDAIKELGVTEFPSATLSGWETRLNEGLLDIESAEDIVCGEMDDMLFAVNPENGNIHKIILYIPQRAKYLIDKWGSYPKYHLFHCKTTALEKFFKGQNEKYRISSRSDGKFSFKIVDDKEVVEEFSNLELKFCGNCFNVFKERFNKKKSEFNLQEFLQTNYSGILKDPTFKFDYDDIPNIYSSNWKELASKYKALKKYTCEACKWKPKNDNQQKFIHAHHIDGMKYNNKLDNIKILCIGCHAKQDNHGFIKKTPDYKYYMEIK